MIIFGGLKLQFWDKRMGFLTLSKQSLRCTQQKLYTYINWQLAWKIRLRFSKIYNGLLAEWRLTCKCLLLIIGFFYKFDGQYALKRLLWHHIISFRRKLTHKNRVLMFFFFSSSTGIIRLSSWSRGRAVSII